MKKIKWIKNFVFYAVDIHDNVLSWCQSESEK